MKIEFDLTPGLNPNAYEAATAAARQAAVLRLFAEREISTGCAAEALGMGLEAFMTWASARGVSVLDLDAGDVQAEIKAFEDAAGQAP
jgi:predicted HTH domain antitoxin